jgi:dipeptidyl aminopeptidase/acylaminoacyl peptidase
MKIAMNILIGIALLVVLLPCILVYANTHPPRYPLNIPPSLYQGDYEAVSFSSEDGIPLKGWLVYPPHKRSRIPAIIICHGVGANKSDFTELAVELSRRGYTVLLFDFRAHGESGGNRSSLGYHEQKDIAAALAFLKARPGIDPKRIGIYGFSMGASAAILAAARVHEFSAVVADSAFTSLKDMARTAVTGFYHLPSFPFLHLAVLSYELYFQTGIDAISPVGVIKDLSPTPLLIIAGEGDTLIPAENGRRLFAAAREPKELWVIPGADHGATLAAAGSAYEKRVGEFFDKYLNRDHLRDH